MDFDPTDILYISNYLLVGIRIEYCIEGLSLFGGLNWTFVKVNDSLKIWRFIF